MRDDKDEDVMCWNCFTVDNVDEDIEPITLKKVRIQQREKLKVYPFLASELTKPRAVALKQKLSSHYQIGKKNSEKIHKIKELHSDKVPESTNIVNEDSNNDNDTDKDQDVPPESKQFDTTDSADKHLEEIDVGETVKSQSMQLVISDEIFNRNTAEASTREKSKEKCDDHINKNLKANTTANQSVTTKDENKDSELSVQNTSKILHSASTITVEEADENDDISEISDNPLDAFQEVLEHADSYYASNLSDLAVKDTESKFDAKITPPKSPVSRIPLKIDKLTPESGKKLPSRNSLESPTTRYETSTPLKAAKNVELKNNSPKLGKIASDTNVKKRSDSFLKYLGLSKKKYREPLKTERPSTTIEDKIKNINFKMPTSETFSELDEAVSEVNEDNVARGIEDVVEKCSTPNSESGYAGSTATLKDMDANSDNSLQLRAKSVENMKTKVHEDRISRDEKVFTSLSSLSNIPKLSSLSKSSTLTPLKKPVKSLRWSTLSMPARKFSFEDDIYISESSAPHHGATLPRRSNSPLPHERDFDRERFPLNRSGLQARSESMASVYSGAGEARGGVAVRGEVQFSLLYNYRLGALEVGVRGCRDLAPVDVKRNRSDPYVKVYLLPDKSKSGKRKTKVKKNTLSPVFEETLSFVQPLSSVASRTLWLSVWHADIFGRNDFLGEVRLPLADIVFDDPAPVWYKLHERTEQFDEQSGSRGDLIVALKLEADARGKGTLRVLVKEAKGLVATKPNGLADVFCKSYLLPERGRLGKQKTGVCRRSLSPRWDHELVYRGVTSQQLAARALELSLWDRDRLASNDFMGAVRLSLGTGTYMGAAVNWMDSMGKEISLWQDMLDRPNLWVEGSLPLRPQLNN